MQELFPTLSDDEIEQLDQFLLGRFDEDADTARERDEGIVDVSGLDGFFTAIVSGPVTIPPSQWLSAIWGDYEPDWGEGKEFENISSLLLRHMNGIAAMLADFPDEFDPLFLERKVNNKIYTIVDEWCEGYSRGMELAAELWDTGGTEMAELLAPILAFTSLTEWRGHEYPEDEMEAAQDAITPNVLAIYGYWLDRRDDFMSAYETVH